MFMVCLLYYFNGIIVKLKNNLKINKLFIVYVQFCIVLNLNILLLVQILLMLF